MTFQMDGGTGNFCCDTCPEHIKCDDCSDFNDSKAFAEKHGWRTYMGPDKKFAHSCPVCVADFAKGKR